MLCVTKAYALPDVDVIILDFFFKSATLELIEVLPAKEKTLLPRGQIRIAYFVLRYMKALPYQFGWATISSFRDHSRVTE